MNSNVVKVNPEFIYEKIQGKKLVNQPVTPGTGADVHGNDDFIIRHKGCAVTSRVYGYCQVRWFDYVDFFH